MIVLEKYGKDKYGAIKWQCKCDCGNITIVFACNLMRGYTKSCGCYQREEMSIRTRKDLIGQRFERLLIIKESGRTKDKKIRWACKCDCGNETIVTGNNLTKGHIKSCGCLLKEHYTQRFGKNNPNWKDGITSFYEEMRNFIRSIGWAKKVFERDYWTCQRCKNRSRGNIQAHHVILLSEIIGYFNITTIEEARCCELLYDISNGITLCDDCHVWVHSGKNINREFLRFLKGDNECGKTNNFKSSMEPTRDATSNNRT